MKPILSKDSLSRLFYGLNKKDGLLEHIKACYLDTTCVKTRALL